MDWEIDNQDNTENDNGKRSYRVEGMDALLFTVALEVGLLQMKIVEGCAALRHTQSPAKTNSALQLLRDKLGSDRELVTDIIRGSLVEMAEAGTWRCLQEAVGFLHQRSTEFTTFKNSHDHLRSTYSLTRKDLIEKRRLHKELLRQADGNITLLRDKKEDDKVNAKFRLSYADKWLSAQAEVLELRHSAPRTVLPSTSHEQRVHDEIDRAYELQIMEREKAVEYWRLKYAADTAKINELLATKREHLRVTVTRREELQALFNLHEGEMRAWLTFKRERAARLAREKRNRNAATRVQSWWRGEMVRRALGPFKFLRHHVKKSATTSSTSKAKKK